MSRNQDHERKCPDHTEHGRLEELIELYHGNISRMARHVRIGHRAITREGLSYRLRKHGLAKKAAAMRIKGLVTGPRNGEFIKEYGAEYDRFIAAINKSATVEDIIERLGINRRTFYRKLRSYGL